MERVTLAKTDLDPGKMCVALVRGCVFNNLEETITEWNGVVEPGTVFASLGVIHNDVDKVTGIKICALHALVNNRVVVLYVDPKNAWFEAL